MSERDINFMQEALALARLAAEQDEVPVGAVVVCGRRVVGRGYNQREQGRDATLHAEIIAIREACRNLGGWRLPDSTLYVTLEPCPMCAGAMINARIGRVVFGAADPKGGALGGVTDVFACPGWNHHPLYEGGLLAEEASTLIREFFARKR